MSMAKSTGTDERPVGMKEKEKDERRQMKSKEAINTFGHETEKRRMKIFQ
jgi:hypothetical protein